MYSIKIDFTMIFIYVYNVSGKYQVNILILTPTMTWPIKLCQKSSTGMILPDFRLESKINQTYTVLGLDCVEEAKNKRHWLNYKKSVTYQFNSRGFRDQEWPDDLSNVIWCFGDSFTVGMGQPQDEIWPQLMQKKTRIRTINVSMNGASNDWIARKIKELFDTITPNTVCVQWSYLHRRELDDPAAGDEARTMHYNSNDFNDYENFFKNIDLLPASANIIHSWIPKYFNFHYDTDLDQKIYQGMSDRQLKFISDVEQLDYARDGHHYDILTAQKYVDHYLEWCPR
jgi:hypothetical protein